MAKKIGATFGLVFVIGILFVSLDIVASGPATSFQKRSAAPDFSQNVNDFKDSILGGTCLDDSACSVISHCDKGEFPPTCKLQWWFILVAAIVALFIVSSIISCLCCPCCLLYSCGKSICDCLCCCCPSSRGRYSRP